MSTANWNMMSNLSNLSLLHYAFYEFFYDAHFQPHYLTSPDSLQDLEDTLQLLRFNDEVMVYVKHLANLMDPKSLLLIDLYAVHPTLRYCLRQMILTILDGENPDMIILGGSLVSRVDLFMPLEERSTCPTYVDNRELIETLWVNSNFCYPYLVPTAQSPESDHIFWQAYLIHMEAQ